MGVSTSSPSCSIILHRVGWISFVTLVSRSYVVTSFDYYVNLSYSSL